MVRRRDAVAARCAIMAASAEVAMNVAARVAFVGCVVLGSVALAEAGSDEVQAPGVSQQPNALRAMPRNPYDSLFDVAPLTRETTAKPATPAWLPPGGTPAPSVLVEPQILCGITVLRPDPTIDPKIVIAPPREMEHTMRILPAPACR